MMADFQNGLKMTIPETLKDEHADLRAGLTLAAAQPGPIGKAATQLARLCLPHFAQEENSVFPIFGLLYELAAGDVRPEMADRLPQIFNSDSVYLRSHHQSIDSAIEVLLQAAYLAESKTCVELANKLQVHERLEDQVVYPLVILIGKYLRESLGYPAVPGSAESAWHAPQRAEPAGFVVRTEAAAETLDDFLDELVGCNDPAPRPRRLSAHPQCAAV